jgi:hypothetical protein
MLVCLPTLGLLFVSCDDGDGDGGGGGGGESVSTNGELTVTGLDAYNGKWIAATGGLVSGGLSVFAAAGFTYVNGESKFKCSLIANGSATLKVWDVTSGQPKSYSGNHNNVAFTVVVHDKEEGDGRQLTSGTVRNVSFTDGKGTVAVSLGN